MSTVIATGNGKRPTVLAVAARAPSALAVRDAPGRSVIAAGLRGAPGRHGDLQVETDPVFTYSDGRVSRIDYASGAYKEFTYTLGVLTQLDYVAGAVTVRKAFTYSPDGTLAAITQETL